MTHDPLSRQFHDPDDALAEARALADALLEGRISTEDARRLEQLVIARRDVRQFYVLYVHQQSALASHLAVARPVLGGDDDLDTRTPAGDSTALGDAMVLPAVRETPGTPTAGGDDDDQDLAPAPYSPPRPVPPVSPWYARHWRLGSVAAAVLVFAASVWLITRRGDEPPKMLAKAAASWAPAIVVETIDAQWENPGVTPAVGTPLPIGQRGLLSGLVRLRFDDGADVVIEGPAWFEVEAPGRMRLASGRLAAVVPPRATGFTVVTPNATIIDYGTEFGVEAAPASGATGVEVFQGEVSLVARPATPATPQPASHESPSPSAGGTPRQVRVEALRAGDARRVDAAGVLAVVPPQPDRFVRPARFEEWDRMRHAGPHARWQAASQRIRRDPALAMYYTFNSAQDAPDRLRNRADATAGRADAAATANLGVPAWAQGRWPEKGAASFDARARQGLLVPDYMPASSRQITVAAWVYAHTRAHFATVAKNWGNSVYGQFHLGLYSGDGDLAFQVMPESGNDVTAREGASHPFPTGRWVHVAAVADGQTLRLYRDGKEVAQAPCAGPQPATPISSMSIGFKTGDDGRAASAANPGYWDGRIDELAVWHRPLSPGEIADLCDRGQPGQ